MKSRKESFKNIYRIKKFLYVIIFTLNTNKNNIILKLSIILHIFQNSEVKRARVREQQILLLGKTTRESGKENEEFEFSHEFLYLLLFCYAFQIY